MCASLALDGQGREECCQQCSSVCKCVSVCVCLCYLVHRMCWAEWGCVGYTLGLADTRRRHRIVELATIFLAHAICTSVVNINSDDTDTLFVLPSKRAAIQENTNYHYNTHSTRKSYRTHISASFGRMMGVAR